MQYNERVWYVNVSVIVLGLLLQFAEGYDEFTSTKSECMILLVVFGLPSKFRVRLEYEY